MKRWTVAACVLGTVGLAVGARAWRRRSCPARTGGPPEAAPKNPGFVPPAPSAQTAPTLRAAEPTPPASAPVQVLPGGWRTYYVSDEGRAPEPPEVQVMRPVDRPGPLPAERRPEPGPPLPGNGGVVAPSTALPAPVPAGGLVSPASDDAAGVAAGVAAFDLLLNT